MIAMDSKGGKDAPEVDTSTSVELAVNPIAFDSTNAYKTLNDFPRDVADAIHGSLETYVDIATVKPARKGAVVNDADLAAVFDQAAIARIVGTPDRDVLLDEGLPKATGRVRVTSPTMDLYALAETDGKVMLVTAIVQLGIEIEAKAGAITITRFGSMVFAPQPDGTWKVTGWTLHVERSGAGLGPTASTAAPTTSTTVAG